MASTAHGMVVLLLIPFPMHAHLNQLLHLSRLLAARRLPVHFAATAAHIHQTLQRLHGWNPKSVTSIVFHHLPPLHHHSPKPDPNSSTRFPSHLQPLFDEAVTVLRRPVADLTRQLCSQHRRVVIIYDSLMGSVVQDFVKFPNAEGYSFHSVSACTIFYFFWENLRRPFKVDPEVPENLPSLDGCFTPEFFDFVKNQHQYMSLCSGRIYNTSIVLEQKFLNLLARTEISSNKKQWALGPFNPVNNPDSFCNDKTRHECMEWLDRQAPNSVILVSFGTTTTLPEKQIRELALGLENSRQKFVWVIRNGDGGDCMDAVNGVNADIELPLGFEARVEERGKIVTDWAPQLGILGHFATGGFMNHCGWNSSMESISMGVPIAAWPMHSDQPRNAVLISEVLKIGIVVREWGRRPEVVTAATVESAVRTMMASEEGMAMRKRAEELGAAVREAEAEGGATQQELESFVSYITR